MKHSTAFDTSSELLVQRYRNGIQLIKPESNFSQTPTKSISHIYNLPIYIYFFNLESEWVSVNSASSEELGISGSEVSGKNIEYFFAKESAEQLLKNNQQVTNSTNLNIFDESGPSKRWSGISIDFF